MNHEKPAVPMEAPLNDIVEHVEHKQRPLVAEETTASQELSGRRSVTHGVVSSNDAQASRRCRSGAIIAIALFCTYYASRKS